MIPQGGTNVDYILLNWDFKCSHVSFRKTSVKNDKAGPMGDGGFKLNQSKNYLIN